MTADGQLLTASATENADLFWGIRGGGGNFGVVTSFEYRLHPVGPTSSAGSSLHPLSAEQEVLRFYREFAPTAPDELTTHLARRSTTPGGDPVVALPRVLQRAARAGRRGDPAPAGIRLAAGRIPSARSRTPSCRRWTTPLAPAGGPTTGSPASSRGSPMRRSTRLPVSSRRARRRLRDVLEQFGGP